MLRASAPALGLSLLALLSPCDDGDAPGEVGVPAAPVAPAAVDLRPRFAAFGLEPRAQGRRPTCSIFTTVAAIEFAVARARGRGERLSVEYGNWSANAATGRRDDGDFFHFALRGFEEFGLCRDALLPYAAEFDAGLVPPPLALVDGGRLLGELGARLDVRWLRPHDGGRGLSEAQFDAVLATLRDGWPVAAGSAHSRLLVGHRPDADAPGGGVFLTLDSALGRYDEVSAAFVREEVCDAFVVEVAEAE